jgi:hypothetical protein
MNQPSSSFGPPCLDDAIVLFVLVVALVVMRPAPAPSLYRPLPSQLPSEPLHGVGRVARPLSLACRI